MPTEKTIHIPSYIDDTKLSDILHISPSINTRHPINKTSPRRINPDPASLKCVILPLLFSIDQSVSSFIESDSEVVWRLTCCPHCSRASSRVNSPTATPQPSTLKHTRGGSRVHARLGRGKEERTRAPPILPDGPTRFLNGNSPPARTAPSPVVDRTTCYKACRSLLQKMDRRAARAPRELVRGIR